MIGVAIRAVYGARHTVVCRGQAQLLAAVHYVEFQMELSEYIRKANIPNVILSRARAQDGVNSELKGKANSDAVHCLCILRLVDSVEQSARVLRVRLKSFEWFELEFLDIEECSNAAYTISNLSRIENVELSYPFFYKADFEASEDGWSLFAMEQQLATVTKGDTNWRLTDVNAGYVLCASYPRRAIVPAGVTDRMLLQSSQFRAQGRFPILAFLHERAAPGRKFVPLLRSGQPLVGASGRRCAEDEQLLRAVLATSAIGYVVDTRSSAAVRNAMQRGGGGCEIESFYSGWRPEYHGLVETGGAANLPDALQRFADAVNDVTLNSSKYISRMDASGWPKLVRDTLGCAVRVASVLHDDGAPVLVHGTDGTDCTLLVTSLAQLLLTSASRTIRGFASLIEREFVQAGHPFAERAAPNIANVASQAPFVLFLDIVWQLTQQFPTAFEFNEQLLVLLAEESMASRFGTFLANCTWDQEKLELVKSTVSIWSFVLAPSVASQFVNAFYRVYDDVLRPCCAPAYFSVWSDMYQRCVLDLRESRATRERYVALKRDYDALKRRYNEKFASGIQTVAVEQNAETSSVDSADFEKITVS